LQQLRAKCERRIDGVGADLDIGERGSLDRYGLATLQDHAVAEQIGMVAVLGAQADFRAAEADEDQQHRRCGCKSPPAVHSRTVGERIRVGKPQKTGDAISDSRRRDV
jgi:hypothetical protein